MITLSHYESKSAAIRLHIIEQLAVMPEGAPRRELLERVLGDSPSASKIWVFIDLLSTMADEGIVRFSWSRSPRRVELVWRLTVDAWLRHAHEQQAAHA